VDADWACLFNSYYHSVGPMHARPQRGLLSRPTLAQVLDYRAQVDARIAGGLERGDFECEAQQRIVLGLQHEQQHQELLLTDIKHAFWCNPLRPAYRENLAIGAVADSAVDAASLRWIAGDQGVVEIGAPRWPEDSDVFAFDNESPRHRMLLQPHALANRPVSNDDYHAFIEDGGYRTPTLWLSAGWGRVQEQGWQRPLYWDDADAREFSLGGMRAIDPQAPVSHLSYYEADAFARWAGARLPTEAEWEHAAAALPVRGNFADDGLLHPAGAPAQSKHAGLLQMFGDVWEWTASAYAPYPGFRAMAGALGEYNGKFMCAQQVLRGGSCATPADHVRASYRNFFQPPDRWQFSGLRLARDLR
ncbi:MAG: ergothioneine biosynthesis protein EgtB, partial [Gammaproteobacteria bacterium]|nr:ergothioneine biosynthesis protein EgtB [Gammaproteobacteria bacterium]